MKNYIKNYNDDYYVFKLTANQEKHIEYMNTGFNHIYNDNGICKLYTYDGYIILDQDAEKLFETYGDDDVLSIDSTRNSKTQGIYEYAERLSRCAEN